MHLNLFKTKNENRIDIYYSSMTPTLERVIGIIRQDKPLIYGTCEDEKILLELEDILYFDTVDRRSFAYTSKLACQISQTIGNLEEELSGFGFVRINKSNIVNIYKIKKIKPEANMRIKVLLVNGEYLQINRTYKRSFEKYLIQYRKAL